MILGPKAIGRAFNDIHLCLYQCFRIPITLKTEGKFSLLIFGYDKMYTC